MTPSAPTKILYCENNVDGTVGGSYYSLLYLVKGLDRRRYEPIVVFYTEHALLPAFRDAGVETLLWPRPAAFTFAARWGVLRPPILVLQKALNFVLRFALPSLARAWFLRRQHIRLVHLNNSVLYNHDWMLGAAIARVKCLTHERGINERYPPAAKYFGRRLDAVICISEAVKRNMQERGADFDNLITIYNGLDPHAMQTRVPPHELRAAHRVPQAAIVIGMVGNIRAWKGQDTLIRALDTVRHVVPDVRCVLIGDTSPADREYERTLRSLISSLNLEDYVTFTGFQRNVADFLMMCDAVVHASVLPEPFGRVVLEAMACRKPVIGARAGAIPEIIEEGKSGLTFAPGDAAGLADALLRVIGDREEARRLGENGYARLERQFHIRRNIEATQSVYERLLRATHQSA